MSDKLPDFEWEDFCRDEGYAYVADPYIALDVRENGRRSDDDKIAAVHKLDATTARALGEWLIKAANQLEGNG